MSAGVEGVVAGAAREDRRRRHTPSFGQRGVESSGRLIAFDKPRHRLKPKARRSEGCFGPFSAADVEPQCARRVRHVFDRFARHRETQPRFRQQHAPDLAKNVRLMSRDP